MTERINKGHVIRAAAELRDACERAGIDCGPLHVTPGSATNGNAWELTEYDKALDQYVTPPIGGRVIGYDRTARSAYHDITTRTRAVNDMRRTLDIAPKRTTRDRVLDNLTADHA